MDYNKVLEYHIDKRADITVVTADLRPWEDSSRFGQVIKDEDNRIVSLEEKPMEEISREVNAGIYIIRRRLLIELLEECIKEDRFDFVRDVIIRHRSVKKIYAYKTENYWSNIASAYSYYKTNMDFLDPDVIKYFFKDNHVILTKANDYPPAKYNANSHVTNSLVASGTIINGTVENSIISKKSYIGDNVVIKNSIILNDVYIGDNSVIENCIVESHNTIYANSRYTGDPNNIRVVSEINDRYSV